MSETRKELIIVRHAKSDWNYDGIRDMDRHLKLRGIKDAYKMAELLNKKGFVADKIITSPATRAFHTARIFCDVTKAPFGMIEVNTKLYAEGMREILKVITSQPDSINRLMVFGHNPDFSYLASHLSKSGHIELSTCSMVKLLYGISEWGEINRAKPISEEFMSPKKNT